MRLRLGLLGWGRVARLIHGKVLASVPEIAVVAVAEPDGAARREALRRFPDARAVEDHRQLLSLPGVDAVLVGVPTFLHAEAAAAAFHGGRHVYLEKPLARDLDEAAELIAAWRAAGTAGMIGFNFRYDVRYQEARRRLAAGEVGRPLTARTVFTTTRKPVPDWKKARATGGGALLELGSHDFDLVRFLFGGEIAVLHARLESIEHEQDMARVALRLEGGVTVECLACTSTSDYAVLEVYGDRGKLTVDRLRSPVVDVQAPVVNPSAGRLARDGAAALLGRLFRPVAWRGVHPLHSYRNALRAFARAALDGGPCSPDLDDGWRSLAVVAAAEACAAEAAGTAPVPIRR